MLGDARSLTAPNFKPATGSPALTGGAAPPNDGFFDTTATFVGAVGRRRLDGGLDRVPAKLSEQPQALFPAPVGERAHFQARRASRVFAAFSRLSRARHLRHLTSAP